MKRGSAILALLATAATVPASPSVYRTMPAPGVRHYVYEVVQTINGTTHKGYHTEFDLESEAGALFAIVRTTAELDNGAWKPVVPDPACRAAMKGTDKSLARVQLYPIDPKEPNKLGTGFLADCAPPAVFFPLTDILNIMVIPIPGPFRASELRKTGETLSYAGFDADYNRAGEHLEESAHGGEMRLAALDPVHATVEWRPLPADLTLVEQAQKPPMTMQGSEHFAFRLDIDRRTGTIERASSLYDDLDLKIVGVPDSVPHVRISRTVTIERR